MSRRALALSLCILAVGLGQVPLYAQGRYLEGSVDLRNINRDAYSSGVAICFNFLGNEDHNCLVSAFHFIHDDANQSILISQELTTVFEYNSFVRATPEGDRCFRARLHASPQGGTSNQFGSSRRCFPNPDDLCPLVVDLGTAGLDLTGREHPVEFDLDADGVPDRISWTAAEAADAFLALDRNGNGVVDDGTELFGNATPQVPGPVPNGFSALALFDDPEHGGDGDDRITPADEIFGHLRLWRDANHDGLSQPAEITTLAEHGILALDTFAVESEAKDRHGNRFRFRGRFFRQDPPPGRVIDVFFVRAR